MAQVIQAAWAAANIRLEILPGDNKQTLTKYRARTHDIYIGRWGPDYQDPHTNADTFASNPDNADGAPWAGKLAWRNAWEIPELSAKTAAAVLERDREKRAEIYEELQRACSRTDLRDHVPGHRGDRRARRRRGHDLGPFVRRQQVLEGPQGLARREAGTRISVSFSPPGSPSMAELCYAPALKPENDTVGRKVTLVSLR